MSVVRVPSVYNGASPHSLSCFSTLILILCIGTWPGPSIITWQPLSQALLVSSPSVSSSANWAQPGDEREAHVVHAHEIEDLVEAHEQEALLVAGQAQFRHDGAAARDYAG